MKYRSILMLIVMVIFTSCNSTLEDPDKVKPEEMMQFYTEEPALAAGERTKVIVRVPKESGVIDISLSATAGAFVQTNGKAIKELTDSLAGDYRYASTVLVSDGSTGTVYLSAEFKTVRKRITVQFN